MSSSQPAPDSENTAAVENEDGEPSMEDILSSIRRIISDDDETETADAAQVQTNAPAATEPPAEAEEEPAIEDVLELTDVFEEENSADNQAEAKPEGETQQAAAVEPQPEPEPAAEVMDISVDEVDFAEVEPQMPEPQPAPVAEPAAPAKPVATELLSADAELASSAAFNQLAATILSNSQQTRTVEDLIQEMLKPMLKSWLDENLPDTVERLVREEIERVARRR